MFNETDHLSFKGRAAIVTGAGGGLGREYALLLASRGASVVVNDLGGTRSGSGSDRRAADLVVEEIIRAGGKAVANYDSVENGEAIVKTAIDNFGRIDILINNAGILRDKSFLKITEEDWDSIHRVHLRGSYLVTKAAWPYFREQNYGRIIMTSSNAGLFGNFGQSNYSSAKLGLIGLSKTLAIEGAKYNIHSNTIIPVAGSRLTEDILPPNLYEQFKPKFVAPVVAWLCHENCPDSGEIFEAAGGWVGKYTWRRSLGKAFIPPETMSIEAVRDNWSVITNMENPTYPHTIHEQISQLVSSINGMTPSVDSIDRSLANSDNEIYSYSSDNVILYALGVGVNLTEPSHLKYLNESHPEFSPLPTFGVIPALKAMFQNDILAEAARKNGFNIDPTRLLHGEQYLELLNPLPIEGQLRSTSRIVEVLDKGSGALIVAEVESQDLEGRPVLYNQFSLFILGAGKFGGPRSSNNPRIKTIVAYPSRSPDAVVTERTSPNQAALYRLSGDKNPLHIDPSFAAAAGFNKPILHGLCSLGFAARHVLKTFANDDPLLFKAIKARFSGVIYPGETIKSEMWKEENRVFVRSTVVESGKVILEGAYVDLSSQASLVNTTSSSENLVSNDFEKVSLEAFQEDEGYLVSDPIFEEIGRRIKMAPDVASKVNAVYEFNITKDGNSVRNWDLKSENKGVFPGSFKNGTPNCIIKMSDEDMTALALGDLDPVKGFMEGQIKIVGDPGITQKLNYIFRLDSSRLHEERFDPEEKVQALPSGQGSFASSSFQPPIYAAGGDGSSGGGDDEKNRCKIDSVFENWAAQRLADMKSLIPTIKTVYQWNITKEGKLASVWTCDFKNGDGAIHRGTPKTGKPDCTLTIDDEFVCRIFEGKEDAMRAFMSGKLKIGGNILAAQKLQQLWAEEAPNVAAQLSKTKSSTKQENKSTSESKTEENDPEINAIPTTGYKCDLIFNVFRNRCHEEPDFLKRLRVTFQFNVLRNGKPACVWTADNKTQSTVEVYRDAPRNVKPDCIVTMEDEDLLKVMVGKLNPQRLFMQGKVRVKGNIMLLQKLNSLWQEYQKLGKNPDLPIAMDILLEHPLKVGLKSEVLVIDIVQRVVRLPQLLREAKGVHNLIVTKDKKVVSEWIIDLSGNSPSVKRGSPPNPTSTITVDDYDLARLVLMKMRLADAVSQKRVIIEGDKEKAMKFDKIFTTPTSMKPKL